ncbi:SH3 domain-containing protein [Priestia aryabhattai]
MNKKLSLIILFLLFISLISVLLAFMAFSRQGNNEDVGQLKTGYDQLLKKVNELKVTTDELDTKIADGAKTTPTNSEVPATPANPVPTNPAPTPTKTVVSVNVNMRSDPTTTGKVVRQLPKGEKVTPTGTTTSAAGFQWIQVKDSKGNEGWVVSTFIK